MEFKIGDRVILNLGYLSDGLNWEGRGKIGTIIDIMNDSYFPITVKWNGIINSIDYIRRELFYYKDAIEKLNEIF